MARLCVQVRKIGSNNAEAINEASNKSKLLTSIIIIRYYSESSSVSPFLSDNVGQFNSCYYNGTSDSH